MQFNLYSIQRYNLNPNKLYAVNIQTMRPSAEGLRFLALCPADNAQDLSSKHVSCVILFDSMIRRLLFSVIRE